MSTFSDLIFNPASRMNEVYRYSGTYQNNKESLAEHITDVSFIAYLISKKLESYGEDINVGILLEKCLLHDIDEVITGDIPRNTKYASKEAHEAMSEVADESAKLLSTYTGIESLYNTWSYAKKGKEGYILSVADMLCVVKKAMVEIELYNNKSFLRVADELKGHLSAMLSKGAAGVFTEESSTNFISELITDAKNEVDRIYDLNKDFIFKYRIYENVLR